MTLKILFVLFCPLLAWDSVDPTAHAEAVSTAAIYRLALQQADPSRNFLLAPQEVQKLLHDLQETAATTDGHSSSSSESNESPTEGAIKVQNTIVISNESNNGLRRLTNSRVEINPTSRPAEGDNESVELLNSVTLQARWAFNLQQRDTYKQPFHVAPHTRLVHRDFMRKDDIFRYGRLDDLNATALELRLHDAEHAVLIVLPHELDGLARLEEQLGDLDVVEDIVARRLRLTLVRILMPKFKFRHRVDLREFVEMAELDSNVTRIHHEAAIEVNEDGLGSFGERTVLFWNAYSSLRTTPRLFSMDHPFFFAIRHNDRGVRCVGHVARL